jgi:hypothetical protein
MRKDLIPIILILATIYFVTPTKLIINLLGFSVFTMLSFFIFNSLDHILCTAIPKLSDLKSKYYNLVKWYSFSVIYSILFVLFLKYNDVNNALVFPNLITSTFFIWLLFGILYVDYITSSNTAASKKISKNLKTNKDEFSKNELLNNVIDSVNKNLSDARQLNGLVFLSVFIMILLWLLNFKHTPSVVNSIFVFIINCMDIIVVKILSIIIFIIIGIPSLSEAISHFFRARVNKKEILDALDIDTKKNEI